MSLVNLSDQLALGIDIGGTNTKFGIVNHRGEILEKGSIKTDQFEKIEDFINQLYIEIKPILDKHSSGKNLAGIGVGGPNANY